MSQLGLFGPVVEKKTAKKDSPRGCEYCPLNEIQGVNKIMPRIRGRRILIVGQSPGQDENTEKREFVGESGEFLWTELERVGISRSDVDLLNSVKCLPCDVTESSYDVYLKMRTPTLQEVHCCSIHTENAMKEVLTIGRTRHILVLGQIAGKQLLKVAKLPAKKHFWSEQFKAWIYLADHPAFFIRGYGAGARLEGFRSSLQALADAWRADASSGPDAEHTAPLRFGFMRKQRYIWIADRPQAEKAEKLIEKYLDGRLAVDVEDDVIDGQQTIFAIGFCPRPGLAFVFDTLNEEVMAVAKRIIENRKIKKVMQYGCTDTKKLSELYGIEVRGWDFDTYLGACFMEPGLGAYGLDDIAMRQFPEFTGYKDDIVQELIAVQDVQLPKQIKSTDSMGKWLGANGYYHLSKLSKDIIRLYNGADVDLCKRAEMSMRNAEECPIALMRLYIDLTFVLEKMQKNGPLFDYKQHQALEIIYPYKEAKLLAEIRKKARDPEFKPGSPQQVFDLVYNRLHLKYPFAGTHGKGAKANTQKKTMLMLAQEHQLPGLIIEWRKVSKGNSTYIKGYKFCADQNSGRLRTKWNCTGTATGRFSSGGKRQDPGVVNFQNIHKDQQMQNMCVADRRWRKVYRAIGRILKKFTEDKWERVIEAWIRRHMPDLRVFLILDYGQVEVRVAAQVSGDKNLLKDCAESDIHTKVGVTMTGWAAEQIANDEVTRTRTKNVHFGILFGISKENLYNFIIAMTPPPRDEKERADREANPITREWVEEAYDKYFARYKGVAQYIVDQREFAREHGYCETLFGWRRKLHITDDYEEDTDTDFETDERGTYWGNQCINCVDMKTEALTQRGWVKGTDLRRGDVLLTKNPVTGCLEWQSCTDVKVYADYKLPLIEFRSRSFSAASTLDHRWLTGNGKCTLTADITQDTRIHRTGTYDGPSQSIYSDDFVRLAGWWLTDGSMPTGEGYSKSACWIWQSQRGNPKKVRMIDALMKRMYSNEGLHFRTPLPKNRRDEVGWSFAGTFGTKLRALFPARHLTPEFLVQLPHRQLEILLHTMLLGDGTGSRLDRLESKHMCGAANGKISFGTGSLEQADAVQMLVSLTGRQASLSWRDCGKYNATRKRYASMSNNPQAGDCFYGLNICRRKYAHIYPEHKRMISNKGIWCPMVPNTYFVARRDGFVFVTGNTPVQGSAHQLLICGLINLYRQPEKYEVLDVPQMDVHDALYMSVKVLELMEAWDSAAYLLEKESLATVKSDFPHIEWRAPIVTEAKAGIRLGTRVKLKKGMTIGRFMLDWYNVCQKQIKDLNKELAEVAAAQ